jgi:FAD/FMN-containing dehydrogenase/Fe-S oxidoreductase
VTQRSLLAERLAREIEGEVLFDAFSRGRYSTDASIYQIEPVGVVVPKTEADAARALAVAADLGVPLLPRGAGTSQCGQTVGEALVIDYSKYLREIVAFDPEARTITVQPGIVLDHLNAFLRPYGLWYPVDVSTAAQATVGGMAGNNSCGARSLAYGNMVHNVLEVEALLASGERLTFGPVPEAGKPVSGPPAYRRLVETVRALYRREREEIAARVPKVMRRVAGYNLDLAADAGPFNMAHLLVGSEGTLACFQRLKLKLSPLPFHKTLGVVHFASFYKAMESTQHIVRLRPAAVELVDRTMIELSREIAQFRDTVAKFIRGEPEAILLVEFAGEDRDEQLAKLKRLGELMGDLGLPGRVVEVIDPALQKDVWEVRKAGLNIMMSMKGDGKPVSFIEDCAVPLEHLADYTDRLTRVFEKHGTRGTWYAHASVGCLHVRPVLNMKSEEGAQKMRAIAEEACALVKEYKGSYSGEHGDGLVRSEWIEPIYGPRLVRAFEELKQAFDPRGLMNPGKIVRPPRMDDRRLFRFKPGYRTLPLETALDWSEYEAGPSRGPGGGFAAAVEMCNNNGHCRKFDAGVMCPSYRVTRDEQHLTRGRANTLRLALSGQLGPDAFTSPAMYETLALCVSCKGCRRECPTGVDMAQMKIEFLHHYHRRHPRCLKDQLVAHLPRYAPWAARLAPLLNLRDRLPGLAALSERLLGLSARRSLPRWRRDFFRPQEAGRPAAAPVGEVVLLADTFNTYFEPENLRAALRVLAAAGYRVAVAAPADGGRPLCCGRTYLASGMVEEARAEVRRLIAALQPFVARGVLVVGLEPSCLLTLRDELPAMLPGPEAQALSCRALLFEEFLVKERDAGRLELSLGPIQASRVLVHGHCHQKAFGAFPSVVEVLRVIPGLRVETIESSCCGMAGAFGFDAAHYDVSMKMAELSLLPAVRDAGSEALLVADGTSCRHQIRDGAGRTALHAARVLEQALLAP